MPHNGNWTCQDVFGVVLKSEGLADYIYSISEVIYKHGIDKEKFYTALNDHGIESPTIIKDDLLDLLLSFCHLILDDHIISEEEYKDFELLKILFKIEEGDFYNKRYYQIKDVLEEQISIIWSDNIELSPAEAMLQTRLEDFFDLSYDQYLEFEEFISKLKIRRSVIFYPKIELNTE